jgi:predicted MFS family arabinose efflux permease
MQANGMSVVNWVFLLFGLAIDLGTWGVGFFASRQEYSSYKASS